MKNDLFFLVLFLCPLSLTGQEKLNDLSAPTSPASNILGIQPSTVLSPKSYQSLETTLYSNFFNNSGKAIVPENFSLEFSPYWTKNHGLSLEEYLYPKNDLALIFRNSSFSIASTQSFLLGDSTSSTALGFGYRTTLYFSNRGDRKRIEDMRKTLYAGQRIIALFMAKSEELIGKYNIDSQRKFIDSISPFLIRKIFEVYELKTIKDAEKLIDKVLLGVKSLPEFNKESPDDYLDAFSYLLDEELGSTYIFDTFERYIKERQGFSMDLAYANLLNFPTNNFGFSIVPRQSFWITPSYRFENDWSMLKVMGVIRYEWYNLDYYKKYFEGTTAYTNNVDLGIAICGEFKRISIQFEAVARSSHTEIPSGVDDEGNDLFRKEKSNDFQYLAAFSYNLSSQVVMTYSLGNRFDPLQNPENTLVSLLTLNFGFGTPTKADLNLEK